MLTKERQRFDTLLDKTERLSLLRIKEEKDKLVSLERIKDLSDPDYILSKGYSITTHQGKVLKNPKSVKTDDEIITILHKGKLKSKVK